MNLSLHSLRLNARIVALTAILSVLWFNIAYIEHQLDLTPSHHTQHHCQLYSGVHQGMSMAVPLIPVWVEHGYPEPVTTPLTLSLLYLAYLARSPPAA